MRGAVRGAGQVRSVQAGCVLYLAHIVVSILVPISTLRSRERREEEGERNRREDVHEVTGKGQAGCRVTVRYGACRNQCTVQSNAPQRSAAQYTVS
jgi:hypothetical protein